MIVLLVLVIVFFGIAIYRAKNISHEDAMKNQEISKERGVASKVVFEVAPELGCAQGWSEYRQDVLGIEFCYPEEWGTPTTNPVENITRISNMTETFNAQNTFYENALNVIFEKNDKVRLKIFNDQYNGMGQENTNAPYIYYESGSTDDVVLLKNGGSICDYRIGYNYRYNPEMRSDVLSVIYSDCSNGIRTVLTEDEEFFDFNNIGTLYTYDLRLLSFKKLANGYFDNVLVSRSVDRASQIKEELATIDDFFNGRKTTKVEGGVPAKTKEQFNQEQKEFEMFINSIVAFKPVPESKAEFKQIPNEDPNITTIRKYYWLIETGMIDNAYAMYEDKVTTSKEGFKKWYWNTLKAEPFDFKKIEGNTYEFYVRYQDHNSPEKKFRVTMEVSGDIIKTKFIEEYLSEVVAFSNMNSYAAKRGDKNYLILNKNGKEIIVDQGEADYNESYDNIGGVKYFHDPKFSPNGNYLTYSMTGWEWMVGYIYDIKNDKKIEGTAAADLGSTSQFDFTADEKNFYMCSSAGMASGPGGKIYSVPGFNVEYDVLTDPRNDKFMTVICSYDKNNNSILFSLGEYMERDSVQTDKTEKIEYDLGAKKVK